jgi:hypothetical protein
MAALLAFKLSTYTHLLVLLATTGVGSGGRGAQSLICNGPDVVDAPTGVDEQRRGRQSHEGQQQRIFDQVLSLLVSEKILQNIHDWLYTPFLLFSGTILMSGCPAFVILGSSSFPLTSVENC